MPERQIDEGTAIAADGYMMMNFDDTSASAAAQNIRAGKLGCRELLEEYLDRIESVNPALNAVVTIDADGARVTADRLDEEARAGRFRGALHGLPITVKDALDVEGMRSTCGAESLRDRVPSDDARGVQLLREAGAIVVGKTNVPEWCTDVQTSNQIFGTTNNPWNLGRTPGGSSGGSAAAISAGLAAIELGTDIGGSIRIPSGYCGVYGHKPTYGIVPQAGCIDRLDGATSYADINVVGPIARSAADLQLALGLLATNEGPAWTLQLPTPRRRDLTDLRVGVWLEDGAFRLDSAVRDVLVSAVDKLSDCNIQVEDAKPNVDFDEALAVYQRLVYGAASVHHEGNHGIEMAGNHREWLEADFTRWRQIDAWGRYFSVYDVLLCPITPTVAPPHPVAKSAARQDIVVNGVPVDHKYVTAWAGIIGAAYLPSTAAPAGLSADGMPVGMQIVSARYQDLTTLQVARQLEEVLGGYVPPTAPFGQSVESPYGRKSASATQPAGEET